MKSLLGKLGLILIGLAIFGCAEVWGEDWKLFSQDDENIKYYDAEGITRPSKNIVRVWVRWEYKDKGIIEMVKEYGKNYENLKETKELEEINCSDKKMRNLSLTEYSKEGKVILTGSYEGRWQYIIPGSFGEALYQAVCK